MEVNEKKKWSIPLR